MASAELMAARARAAEMFRANPNVSAIAIEQDAFGKLIVAVHLASAVSGPEFPETINGHRIKYVVTGRYRAFGR